VKNSKIINLIFGDRLNGTQQLSHNIMTLYTYSNSTEFGLGKMSSLFGVNSFGGVELVTFALINEGEMSVPLRLLDPSLVQLSIKYQCIIQKIIVNTTKFKII